MEIKLLSGRCGRNKNENESVTRVDSMDGTKFESRAFVSCNYEAIFGWLDSLAPNVCAPMTTAEATAIVENYNLILLGSQYLIVPKQWMEWTWTKISAVSPKN